MQEKAIPRQGMAIEGGGVVTSGSHSPMLDVGIGMGYVPVARPRSPAPSSPSTCAGARARRAIVKKPIYKREETASGGARVLSRRPASTTPSTTGRASRTARRSSAITWFAQDALGELVHYEPPDEGSTIAKDESYGEVESVKAVSDLISPLSGEVLEVNAKVVDAPETVNEDPYGEGWLVRIRLSDPSEVDSLLDAAAYRAHAREPVSYLSLTDADREAMLAAIGVDSVDELFRDIPAGVRFDRELDLEPPLDRAGASAPPRGARRAQRRHRRASSRSSAPGSTTTTFRRSPTPSSSAASS